MPSVIDDKTQRPRIRWLKWVILGLLFVASIINYVDRQTLAILARTIQDDLRISEIGYATVLQFFLAAYTISFLISGWVTDKIGIKKSMTLFIAWWSIANLLTAFVGSMRGLAFARFMLGAGESGLYVVAPKVVARIFPASFRGLAVGIYSAGATLGATIAPPIIAWITLRSEYGWRAAFVVGGVVGLVWIVPWLLFYRSSGSESEAEPDVASSPPPPPAPPTTAHTASATLDYATPVAKESWLADFLSRDVLMLMAIRAITDPVWQFILFYFPKYMTDARQWSLADVGTIGWVPYLAADVGGILGGFASGFLVMRGFRAVDARKWVMALCAIAIPVGTLLITQVQANSLVVGLIAVMAFAEFTWMVTMTALAVDVLPIKRFGRMFGVIAAGSGIGGIIFMQIVGQVVGEQGYTPIFVLMACLHPVAFLLVWLIARRHRNDAANRDVPANTGEVEAAPAAAEGASCK